MGGKSVEHEISILSAIQAINNIDKSKYNVFVFYLTKNNNLIYDKKLDDLNTYKNETHKNKTNVVIYRKDNKIFFKKLFGLKKVRLDVILPIVHGKGVEDGTISGFLEYLGIPYPTSGIEASAIAQNKILTSIILNHYDICTIPYITLSKDEYINMSYIDKVNSFGYPIIIKPCMLGSSIGISIAHNIDELKNHLDESFAYGDILKLERMLENVSEYNCAAISYNNEIITSNIEEVTTSNELLTFSDKYDSGSKVSLHIDNPNIDKDIAKLIIKYTKDIYKLLHFKGVIRIDYLLDKENNKLYVNEINTIPGSLAFYLFKDQMDYSKMLDHIILDALKRNEAEKEFINVINTNILSKSRLKTKK